MTVTRLGQVTAETGAPGEYTKLTSIAVTLDSTIVRSGNYSWNLDTGAGVGLAFPAQSHIRANFAGYLDNEDTGGSIFVLHGSGAYGTALRMRVTPDNILQFMVNATVLVEDAPGAVGFAYGDWNTIGIVYKSGVEGVASVYINGVLWHSHTGDLVGNLDYLVTFYEDTIFSHLQGCHLDDMYVDAITADEEDAAPADKRFLSSLPTNQGVVQWTPVGDTPNYRCVDEAGVPDNDTTYVKVLEAGAQDLYSMSPVALPTDYKIRAIIPTAVAKKGDSALPATLAPVIFDGLNTAVGDDKALSLSYRTAWHRFEAQPDGAPWDESSYASLQYGMRATGTF